MTSKALWSVNATFAPEARSIPATRRFVQNHLSARGMSALVDDVVLVASELSTNAVKHAQTPFTVTLTADRHSVALAVSDASARRPALLHVPTLASTGRGLGIVAGVSRQWGVTDEGRQGKKVWARFDTEH